MDHLVLVVADVERSVAWYRDVLGLEVERFDLWKDGKVLFPSVRIDETTIIDILPGERGAGRGNVDHFCLVIEETDLAA
jgi:catechol 2,3-dioxygenase-like lactoylglutathione lyase family enzyme